MNSIFKRNNVRVLGTGSRYIVFAHGFGCDQNVWSAIQNDFVDDYKLVLFDYVGSGKSDLSAYDPDRYSTLEGYAQDILEICGALEIQQTYFVGHSVSSMIGIIAANRRPGLFQKMVFLGPSPRYLNDVGYIGGFEKEDLNGLLDMIDSNYLGWSRAMAPLIMGNPQSPELGSQLSDNFCATDPEVAKNFARATFLSDYRAELEHLKVESLILQCSEDIIAPLSVGQYMHDNIERNKLIILKATGHCSHMSAPRETVREIKAFL